MSIKKLDNSVLIDDVLQQAAAKTGASADIVSFLKKTASVESSGVINAANPKSSARGIWQLMPDTARNIATKYKKKYPELGSVNGSDNLSPETQGLITTLLTMENQAILKNIKSDITGGNLYLSHFSGADKASEILLAKPDKPINQIFSAKAMEQNSDIYLRKGKEKLYFKDFKAADLIAWADLKMEQPANYGSMTETERAKYRKDKHIPDSAPEAFGDMVMTIITTAIEVMGSLIGGVADFGKMLVTSASANNSLPSPATPNKKLASSGKNAPTV